MSFDRFRVQEYIENSLGCGDLEHWHNYRRQLEEYRLPHQDEDGLRIKLLHDGEDLFYKGMLSLGEALIEIAQGKHSWASVKFYYSVFYFLRASLASKGYALIRNQSQYLLEIRAGRSPERRSSKLYRNDHLGVINIYKDVIGENDILLTNTIDGAFVYDWLMGKRHQVHYRQREFLEPEHLEEYFQARKAIFDSTYSQLIDQYYNDNIPIYCFDSEHASIAAPIKRATLTKQDLRNSGVSKFSDKKLGAAKDMLDNYFPNDSAIWALFDVNY